MKYIKLFLVAFFLCSYIFANQTIFYKNNIPKVKSNFDWYITRLWKNNSVKISKEVSDYGMVRRAYIDLCGRVPTPQETLEYVNSTNPQKQSALIKKILATDDFRIFWTMKFGDELRIKSEFPINLWPNATFLYSRYIYNFLDKNQPYDKFVYNILTSQGSNFRIGEVNFFRALAEKNSLAIAKAVSTMFLGVDFNNLSKESQAGLVKVFDGVKYKNSAEWKEEIVYFEKLPNDITITLPDNSKITITAQSDPRVKFSKWLINKNNAFFARGAVTRFWRWIFGTHPKREIIDYLTKNFEKSNFNVSQLIYEICTSVSYKVSAFPIDTYEKAIKFSATYPVKRLDAEVLADCIMQITNTKYSYSSVIPEPFSYFNTRSVALFDASVTDSFLTLFGRPARDTGLPEERISITNGKQRLHMYNSMDIYNRLRKIVVKGKNKEQKIKYLYLLFFSRPPTNEEINKINKIYPQKNLRTLSSTIGWILINSKEFIFKH